MRVGAAARGAIGAMRSGPYRANQALHSSSIDELVPDLSVMDKTLTRQVSR